MQLLVNACMTIVTKCSMAVKIRETMIIMGEECKNVEKYRSEKGIVTKEDMKLADENDKILHDEIRKIENEMEKLGYLMLRGKKGESLRLWYEVGVRLKPLLDGLDVNSDDRKFLFRAIYDHVEKLASGSPKKRAIETPETSHFSYCYRLAPFSWDFVNQAGDWTTWSELFDSELFRKDHRLIEWLATKQNEKSRTSQQKWLRPLTQKIRNKLKDIITTEFSEKELYEKLDDIYEKLYPKITN